MHKPAVFSLLTDYALYNIRTEQVIYHWLSSKHGKGYNRMIDDYTENTNTENN